MGHPGLVTPLFLTSECPCKRAVTATFLLIAFLPVSAALVRKLRLKRV